MELVEKINLDPARLVAARQSAFPGKTAEWVAKEVLKMTKSALSNIENGRNKPSADKLLQMQIMYGVTAEKIVNVEQSHIADCLRQLVLKA